MKNILIIQPYGAASVDVKNGGNVEILNPMATIISKNLIAKKSSEYILTEILKEYKIENKEDVLNDIREFDKVYEYSTNDWEIIGSSDKVSIITANIELTLKCELSCSYCYANASPKIDVSKELSNSDWNKVIDWLIDNDVKLVTLTGGNPTLSNSFWPIIEKLTNSDIYIRLFTNGIGLDESFINRLKKNNVIFIEVSLDAMNPLIHNKFRGNSHNKAISAIEILSENRFSIGIGSCIHNSNIEELPALAEYANTKNAVLRFGPMTYQGNANLFMKDYFLSSSEMNKLNKIASTLYSKYPQLYYDNADNKYMYENGKCDFYYGIITINPQGKLKPCLLSDDFFERYAPWSISNKRCWEIFEISKLDSYLTIEKIDATYLASEEKCGVCNKLNECSGCLLSGYSCLINSNINN